MYILTLHNCKLVSIQLMSKTRVGINFPKFIPPGEIKYWCLGKREEKLFLNLNKFLKNSPENTCSIKI